MRDLFARLLVVIAFVGLPAFAFLIPFDLRGLGCFLLVQISQEIYYDLFILRETGSLKGRGFLPYMIDIFRRW